MSLRLQPIGSLPEHTALVAHAAFPKGHPYLTLRDHLGTICQDEDFATLSPAWGSPGLPPWRLALVTILPFREHLADRQAAEAVRARIDWKYLLSLELVSHPRIAPSARAATHRLAPCAGGYPRDESPRIGGRNAPGRAQRPGERRARLAPSAGAPRVV